MINTELSKSAHNYPQLKGKFAGLRKFRVGDYRIIFSIIETETVLILRIAHRKEIYRK
jgi:mRNA interferase RelE/StbE